MVRANNFSFGYPTIVVSEKDGKKFVAVIVYGSPERPHFAGKSYIRDGTQTKDASEINILEFIASRDSKANEILKWKGKEITIKWLAELSARMVVVQDCNQHWLTLLITRSVPLRRVDLSFDHSNDRLLLEIQ